MVTHKTSGNRVKIFFHGLMVSKFESDIFKVGIVKNAPDHVFTFFVENDHLTDKIKDETGTLQLKLINADGSLADPIHPNYAVDPRFDRLAPTIDETNFNFVAELDGRDLHDAPIKANPDGFQPKFHFLSGKMSAFELSNPLNKSKGSSSKDYGRMAEILEIDIPIAEGQTLLLTTQSARKIWEHTYKEEKQTKAFVLNMAFYHYRKNPTSSLRACETVTLPATITGRYPHGHFQSYYLSLPQLPNDRFDLFNPNLNPVPTSTGFRTDFPTACGMVRLSRSNIGF